MSKLRVLVAGADSTTYTVLKYLSENENIETLYSLPHNKMLSKMSHLIDIKENDIPSIIEFVKQNDIDLTVVTSPILIVNGIANAFEENGLTVFAPNRDSAIVTYFNAAAKKTMYKLKIPTSRFAIFDKLPNAVPYLRQMHFPVYIQPDFKILTTEKKEYHYFSQAKQALDDLFFDGEEKVVVEENNTALKEYNIYFLTDGFSAYLFGTTEYDENEICISPSPSLSSSLINKIKNDVVIKLLDDIRNFSTQYSGILGVKIKADSEYYKVIDFMSVFEKSDFETIMPSINNNLLNLYYSAATGSLSDDLQSLSFNSLFSCSMLTDTVPNDEINGMKYAPINEDVYIITVSASTVSEAKERLLECAGVKESVYDN